jgi:hypothetical protein
MMANAQRMGAGPNDMIAVSIEQRGVLQNPGGATGNLSPRQKAKSGSSTSTRVAASSTEDASTATQSDTASSSSAASNSTPTQSNNQGTPQSNNQGSTNNQGSSNTQNGNPAASKLLLSPTFTPVTSRTVLDPSTGRVAATVRSLDGEFIVTMSVSPRSASPAQPQLQQPATGTNISLSGTQPAAPTSGAALTMTNGQASSGQVIQASEMMTEYFNQQQSSTTLKQRSSVGGKVKAVRFVV